jgi:hypothetical protein
MVGCANQLQWRQVVGGVKVGPLDRDEAFAAVGQDKDELQAGGHAGQAQDLK